MIVCLDLLKTWCFNKTLVLFFPPVGIKKKPNPPPPPPSPLPGRNKIKPSVYELRLGMWAYEYESAFVY